MNSAGQRIVERLGIRKMDNDRLPGIRETFRDKRVLVFGGTGFLGKLIVEKLLREAPDIARITLLVRANRRGQSAAQRVATEVSRQGGQRRRSRSRPAAVRKPRRAHLPVQQRRQQPVDDR